MNHSRTYSVQSGKRRKEGEWKECLVLEWFTVIQSKSRIRADEADSHRGLSTFYRNLALGLVSASDQTLKWALRCLQPKVASGLLALGLQRGLGWGGGGVECGLRGGKKKGMQLAGECEAACLWVTFRTWTLGCGCLAQNSEALTLGHSAWVGSRSRGQVWQSSCKLVLIKEEGGQKAKGQCSWGVVIIQCKERLWVLGWEWRPCAGGEGEWTMVPTALRRLCYLKE